LETVETEPRIIGWDVAGVVECIGCDVSLFEAGDKVYYAGDITRSTYSRAKEWASCGN
jgi:NADPH:quinone reductase-like Zn-dependent oxidoreductase